MAGPDVARLKVGASVLVAGQVVQALVAFAANLVLVRYIDPSEFGRFALVLASASLVLAVFSARVSVLIIRAPDERFGRALQERYFAILTFETIVALGLGLAWTAYLGLDGPWQILLVGVVCLQHWIHQNKAFYERGMDYAKLGLVETLAAGLAHVLAVVVVLAGGGASALYVRELAAVVLLLLGLWAFGGVTLMSLRWPAAREWRSLFREARGIWLDSTLEAGYQRVMILLAGLLGGESGAGFFFQAYRLSVLPHQLAQPVVGRMAANWFGRESDAEKRRRVRNRLLGLAVVPLGLCALGAVLFADPVVPWIFGATWRPSAGLLAGLAGLVLFMSLFEILKAFCVVTYRIRVLLIGRLAQYLGYGLPLAALFFHPWFSGTTALAAGVSAGYGLAFAVTLAILVRSERARGGKVRP